MPPPLRRRPPLPPGLNLGTYNIREGRGFVLPQEIRAVRLCNYGLMLMMETETPDEAYFHNHLGYNIVCSQVAGTNYEGCQGGVVLGAR